MEVATYVSVAALTTALVGTLAVPLIQDYLTRRREDAQRLEGRQHAVYVDAITYAQIVETRLTELFEDPLVASNRSTPSLPDDLLIRAKLELVAPWWVVRTFGELTDAWDVLCWNLNEDGPTAIYGDEVIFTVNPNGRDAVRLSNALRDFKAAIRPPELDESGG